MRKNKIGIIIQARTGSTRMPSKVILPFYQNKSILDLLITKLKNKFNYTIVVATTDLRQDDCIEKNAIENNVNCFRGEENNVLKRFVDCAEKYGISTIVRVCADNPFLDMNYTADVLNEHLNSQADYTSYCTKEELPVIKTHYGVFCEVVELKGLKMALAYTDDSLYLEHVTNYVYGNPDKFVLNLIPMPDYLEEMKVRLTIDSQEDWNIVQELFVKCIDTNKEFDTKMVLNQLKDDLVKLNVMKQQIDKYSK